MKQLVRTASLIAAIGSVAAPACTKETETAAGTEAASSVPAVAPSTTAQPDTTRKSVTVLTADRPETREAMYLVVDEGLGRDPEVRDSLASLRRRSASLGEEGLRAAEREFGAWLAEWKRHNPERAAAAKAALGERDVMPAPEAARP